MVCLLSALQSFANVGHGSLWSQALVCPHSLQPLAVPAMCSTPLAFQVFSHLGFSTIFEHMVCFGHLYEILGEMHTWGITCVCCVQACPVQPPWGCLCGSSLFCLDGLLLPLSEK